MRNNKKKAEVDTSNGWHPVSETLPNHGQQVRIKSEAGELTAIFFNSEDYWRMLSHENRKRFINFDNYCRMNGRFRFIGKYCLPVPGVTHWQESV